MPDEYDEYRETRTRIPHLEDIYFSEYKPQVNPLVMRQELLAEALGNLTGGYLKYFVRNLRRWNPAISPHADPVTQVRKRALPKPMQDTLVERLYHYPSTVQYMQTLLDPSEPIIILEPDLQRAQMVV